MINKIGGEPMNKIGGKQVKKFGIKPSPERQGQDNILKQG